MDQILLFCFPASAYWDNSAKAWGSASDPSMPSRNTPGHPLVVRAVSYKGPQMTASDFKQALSSLDIALSMLNKALPVEVYDDTDIDFNASRKFAPAGYPIPNFTDEEVAGITPEQLLEIFKNYCTTNICWKDKPQLFWRLWQDDTDGWFIRRKGQPPIDATLQLSPTTLIAPDCYGNWQRVKSPVFLDPDCGLNGETVLNALGDYLRVNYGISFSAQSNPISLKAAIEKASRKIGVLRTNAVYSIGKYTLHYGGNWVEGVTTSKVVGQPFDLENAIRNLFYTLDINTIPFEAIPNKADAYPIIYTDGATYGGVGPMGVACCDCVPTGYKKVDTSPINGMSIYYNPESKLGLSREIALALEAYAEKMAVPPPVPMKASIHIMGDINITMGTDGSWTRTNKEQTLMSNELPDMWKGMTSLQTYLVNTYGAHIPMPPSASTWEEALSFANHQIQDLMDKPAMRLQNLAITFAGDCVAADDTYTYPPKGTPFDLTIAVEALLDTLESIPACTAGDTMGANQFPLILGNDSTFMGVNRDGVFPCEPVEENDKVEQVAAGGGWDAYFNMGCLQRVTREVLLQLEQYATPPTVVHHNVCYASKDGRIFKVLSDSEVVLVDAVTEDITPVTVDIKKVLTAFAAVANIGNVEEVIQSMGVSGTAPIEEALSYFPKLERIAAMMHPAQEPVTVQEEPIAQEITEVVEAAAEEEFSTHMTGYIAGNGAYGNLTYVCGQGWTKERVELTAEISNPDEMLESLAELLEFLDMNVELLYPTAQQTTAPMNSFCVRLQSARYLCITQSQEVLHIPVNAAMSWMPKQIGKYSCLATSKLTANATIAIAECLLSYAEVSGDTALLTIGDMCYTYSGNWESAKGRSTANSDALIPNQQVQQMALSYAGKDVFTPRPYYSVHEVKELLSAYKPLKKVDVDVVPAIVLAITPDVTIGGDIMEPSLPLIIGGVVSCTSGGHFTTATLDAYLVNLREQLFSTVYSDTFDVELQPQVSLMASTLLASEIATHPTYMAFASDDYVYLEGAGVCIKNGHIFKANAEKKTSYNSSLDVTFDLDADSLAVVVQDYANYLFANEVDEKIARVIYTLNKKGC